MGLTLGAGGLLVQRLQLQVVTCFWCVSIQNGVREKFVVFNVSVSLLLFNRATRICTGFNLVEGKVSYCIT